MNVTKKNVKTRQGFVTGDVHGEAVGARRYWEEGALCSAGRKSNLSEFDNTNLPK